MSSLSDERRLPVNPVNPVIHYNDPLQVPLQGTDHSDPPFLDFSRQLRKPFAQC